MKKRTIALLTTLALATGMVAGCGSNNTAADTATDTVKTSEAASEKTEATETVESTEVDDQAAADHVAELIDAIYVQTRNDNTDAQCAEAKEAWDALTDAQKELVSGENADPDYFGRDTGDATKDDPLNEDNIGENELLVVSFGTSFNDSRAEDIGGIEKALEAAYPDWSVRRAFTAQIIINHVQARDDEKIDNVDQALERAVDNGVKNLVVQPTHLMHGAEYDELVEALDNYKDKFADFHVPGNHGIAGYLPLDAHLVHHEGNPLVKIGVIPAHGSVFALDPFNHGREPVISLGIPGFINQGACNGLLPGIRQPFHHRLHQCEMLRRPRFHIMPAGHGLRMLPQVQMNLPMRGSREGFRRHLQNYRHTDGRAAFCGNYHFSFVHAGFGRRGDIDLHPYRTHASGLQIAAVFAADDI